MKKSTQQNFVVKNMIKLGVGKTSVHKDKRKMEKSIRGKKHKESYT